MAQLSNLSYQDAIDLAACRRKEYRTRIFRINADLKQTFIKKSAKISVHPRPIWLFSGFSYRLLAKKRHSHNGYFRYTLLVLLAMTLQACSPVRAVQRKTELSPTVKILNTSPPAATSGVPATVVQLPVPGPTEPPSTATIVPTATPIPPTETPAPTLTPTSMAEPVLPHQPVPSVVISNTFTGFTFTVAVSPNVPLAVDFNSIMPPVRPLDLPANTINIALLGVDTRPKQGGLNTDVIVIASINPDVPAVTLLSIPRDTLAYVPNFGYRKVNGAFVRGGAQLFRQTLLYNYGINVDYFAMVNFSSVVQAVETLGGVEVVATCPLYQVFPRDPYYYADPVTPLTVTSPYVDSFTGEVWQPGTAVPTQTIWIPQAGVYSLNGMQALAYVRARYGMPGGDVDRGRREQRLIRAVLNKAKQIDSLAKLPELYAQFEKSVKTDLTLPDMLKLAAVMATLDDVVIRSRFIDGAGFTSITLPVAGNLLVPNPNGLRDYLQQLLTVALNQRANEGVPIELVNATAREDFGIAAADRLSELGFRVVSITQADKPQPNTQIIDFNTTKKGSAIPLLQRNFGIKDKNIIDQPDAQSTIRYRIVTGADFEPCYYKNAQLAAAKPATTPIAPTPEPTPEG